jgi:hypothetical protein
VPAEEIAAVDEVQHFTSGTLTGNADDETVLMLAMMVAGEELQGIGGIAQDGHDCLHGDMSKKVIRRHPAPDCRRRVAPDSEVELL